MKSLTFLAVAMTIVSSCKKNTVAVVADQYPVFEKIVILGNSITYAPGTVGTEWVGPWGMAASKPELDYIHLLTKDFAAKNVASTVSIRNIAAFERDFINYDFDANLKDLQSLKPDLLIIRIGENAQLSDNNKAAFQNRYKDLIAYFKSNNPKLHVLAVGSVWNNEIGDEIMAQESDFITLKTLLADPTNYAWGLYVDPGIQSHPSDKGMGAIASMIWTKVQTLK